MHEGNKRKCATNAYNSTKRTNMQTNTKTNIHARQVDSPLLDRIDSEIEYSLESKHTGKSFRQHAYIYIYILLILSGNYE